LEAGGIAGLELREAAAGGDLEGAGITSRQGDGKALLLTHLVEVEGLVTATVVGFEGTHCLGQGLVAILCRTDIASVGCLSTALAVLAAD
jgi:hypothetical protein